MSDDPSTILVKIGIYKFQTLDAVLADRRYCMKIISSVPGLRRQLEFAEQIERHFTLGEEKVS